MKVRLLALAGAVLLCSCNPIKGDWKNVNSPEKRWQITGDTMVHISTGTLVAKWKYKWIDDNTIEIMDYATSTPIRKVGIKFVGKRLHLDFGDGQGPTELGAD